MGRKCTARQVTPLPEGVCLLVCKTELAAQCRGEMLNNREVSLSVALIPMEVGSHGPVITKVQQWSLLASSQLFCTPAKFKETRPDGEQSHEPFQCSLHCVWLRALESQAAPSSGAPTAQRGAGDVQLGEKLLELCCPI